MRATKHVYAVIKKSELDDQLTSYSKLCDEIKTLESQKDRLKQALVKSYFESHSTYTSKDKSVIASYMPQNRTQFKNADFKEEHPDLYNDYSYIQEIHIFTVKKLS